MRTFAMEIAVLILGLTAATLLVAGLAAQEPRPLGCEECHRRLGALVAGYEQALSASARGRHDQAQESALAALSAAGYSCEWKPGLTIKSEQRADPLNRRLECRDAGP